MRIVDNLRRCVVFLGYRDATPGGSGIHCIGTGFLLSYKGFGYLITVKHVSHQLGTDPFLIRLNKLDGTSENYEADEFEWSHHPDPTVDIAIIPMHVDADSRYDCEYLDGETLVLSPEQIRTNHIGIGNFTYTLGLFHLLSGKRRNMPICHFGTIAMLPGDERIPIEDWTDPERRRRISVEGYLVESQSLSGLSGSPVFVRPQYYLNFSGLLSRRDGQGPMDELVIGARDPVKLLGVWQGAWDAPADEVLSAGTGKNMRVSIGVGIVVPSQRIVEILEAPDVSQFRVSTLAAEKAALEPKDR